MNLTRVATPLHPDFTAHWTVLVLTDRFGELNESCFDAEAYHLLRRDETRSRALACQMWDDITFVPFVDGQFGVLYEGEFPCIESDAQLGELPVDELDSYESAKTAILARIPALERAFPGVSFAVPDKREMIEERVGLWAFVPEGLITDPLVRRRLGMAVLSAGELEPAEAAA